MEWIVCCSKCGRKPESLLDFKCLCGHPLAVYLDFPFEVEKIRTRNYTIWRYSSFFPYVKEAEIVTLGEGWTPLVEFSENVHFKLENLNPTGSFKDRGSSVLISALRSLLRKHGGYISEDSSGNAGASVAAYAARGGLRARIYVPENVSGPKLNQTRFYDAEIAKVSGARSKVAEEAQRTEKEKVYVGHILHPLFRDGMRSLAYEVLEQLGWSVPERIYLPVSAGTLLLGLTNGFKHLLQSNVIEAMPKIVACQTRQVSPLYHRLKNLKYTPAGKVTSIADALVSVSPPLLDLMVKSLREVRGEAVITEEDEIYNAFLEVARKGFFVEPSSAVAFSGYKKQLEKKEASEDDKAVIILTGSGLKTTLKPEQ